MAKNKEAERKEPKVIMTARVDPGLLGRARGLCWNTPGMTLSKFAEECLRKGLEALEQKQGRSFDPPPHGLKTGRPLKAGAK